MTGIQVTQIIIAEVSTGTFCPNPNAFQFAAIVALVIGSGIVTVSAGISVVAVATTMVTLILSGASIEAIGAAIAGQIGYASASVELVSMLYQGIKNILGC